MEELDKYLYEHDQFPTRRSGNNALVSWILTVLTGRNMPRTREASKTDSTYLLFAAIWVLNDP